MTEDICEYNKEKEDDDSMTVTNLIGLDYNPRFSVGNSYRLRLNDEVSVDADLDRISGRTLIMRLLRKINKDIESDDYIELLSSNGMKVYFQFMKIEGRQIFIHAEYFKD